VAACAGWGSGESSTGEPGSGYFARVHVGALDVCSTVTAPEGGPQVQVRPGGCASCGGLGEARPAGCARVLWAEAAAPPALPPQAAFPRDAPAELAAAWREALQRGGGTGALLRGELQLLPTAKAKPGAGPPPIDRACPPRLWALQAELYGLRFLWLPRLALEAARYLADAGPWSGLVAQLRQHRHARRERSRTGRLDAKAQARAGGGLGAELRHWALSLWTGAGGPADAWDGLLRGRVHVSLTDMQVNLCGLLAAPDPDPAKPGKTLTEPGGGAALALVVHSLALSSRTLDAEEAASSGSDADTSASALPDLPGLELAASELPWQVP
jgi:hypothetical protein